MQISNGFSGVTRDGRVAHPWKVFWGKCWKEGGNEEKRKEEGKKVKGEGKRRGKGKERQGKKGKWKI